MERSEKLRLSAAPDSGYAFREGLFIRLYAQSLYWFATHVRPLKVLALPVKKGGTILCGGLPTRSFEALQQEGRLCGVTAEHALFHWAYEAQPTGSKEDFGGYGAWCEAALAAAAQAQQATEGRDILLEIRNFNLMDCTPLRAMNAIHDWREYLLHSGKKQERTEHHQGETSP